MSSYNLESNKDNTFIRNVIIGVLSVLQDKIYIEQVVSAERTDIIDVPFLFSMTGSQSFLLEHFLNNEWTDAHNKEGYLNYERVPRGVLNMTSISIDSGSLINKFVRMEILRKEDTNLVPYSFETMIIPMNFSFDVRLICNSFIEQFKLTEAIIKKFYKNNVFYIDLGGYKIQGNITLPDDYEHEKPFEYSFSDQQKYEITFSLEVSSYMPVFDEKSKFAVANKMTTVKTFINDISVAPINSVFSNSGYNETTRSNIDEFKNERDVNI